MKEKKKETNVPHRPAGRTSQERMSSETESDFRAVFDNVSDALFIHDLQGRFLDVNHVARERLGYSREELLALTPRDIDSPEYAALVESRITELMQTGSAMFETAHVTRDGRTIPVELSSRIIEFRGQKAVLSIARDITRRKHYEDALREGEERYRTTLLSVGDGIITTDISGNVLLMNSAAEKLTGWSADEAFGRPLNEVFRIVDEATGQAPADPVDEIITRGSMKIAISDQVVLLSRNGKEYGIEKTGAPIRDARGETAGVVLVFRDQTAERDVRKAIEESEERFRSFVENANDIVYSLTPEGIFTYVSPNWKEIVGHDVYEVVGRPFEPLVHPDDVQACRDFLGRVLSSGEKQHGVEYRVRNKDGSWRWHSSNASPLRNAGGEIVSYLGIARDITDKKEAEQALRESEEFQRAMIATSPVALYSIDPRGNVLTWNESAERIFGWKSEEVLGRPLPLVPEDKQAEFKELRRRVLAGESFSNLEIVRRKQDGTLFDCSLSTAPIYDDSGKIIGIMGAMSDITERKRAEEELRESETNLREAQRIARLGRWELDIADKRLHWSDTVFEIFEIDPKRFGASYEAFLDTIHPDDREMVNRAYLESLENRTPYEIEHRLLMKDGRIKWVNEICRTEYDRQGNAVRSVGIVQDITERRRAEEAIRQSRAELEAIYEYAPVMMCVLDEERQVLYANKAFVEYAGKPEDELILGRACGVLGCIHALDDPMGCGHGPRCETCSLRLAMKDTLDTGNGHRDVEYETVLIENGVRRNAVLSGSTARIEIENKNCLLLCLDDITEKKNAEQALRKSEFEKVLILNSTAERFAYCDLDFRIQWANRAYGESVGLSPEELVGRHCHEIWHCRDGVCEECPVKKAQDTGRMEQAEITTPDGRIWHMRGYPVVDDSGKVTGLVQFGQDITERKVAEQALIKSEAFRKLILDNLPVGIAVNSVEPEVQFGYMNDNFIRFYRTTRQEIKSPDDFWEAVYEDPEFRETLRKRVLEDCASGDPERMHWDNLPITRAGEPTTFISARNIPIEGDKLMISVVWDVTERKKAEDALKNSENLLQKVFDILPIGLWIADREGRLFRCNPAGRKIWGAEPLVGPEEYGVFKARRLPSGEEIAPGDWALNHTINRGETIVDEMLEIEALDGEKKIILNYTAPVPDEKGDVGGAIIVNQDITEQKKAEDALRVRLEYELAAAVCMGILAEPGDPDSLLQRVLDTLLEAVKTSRVYIFRNEENPAAGLCMTQTHEAVSEGITPQIDNPLLKHLPYSKGAPSVLPVLRAGKAYARMVAELPDEEREILESQGILSVLILPVFRGQELWGFIGFDDCEKVRRWQEEDIKLLHVVADGIGTALYREHLSRESRKIEEQLVQAQKMESVGRLAGGVAHDFNNMLQTILGYTDMALDDTGPESPLYHSLIEIRKAARRSGDLTSQLLAFARKQTVSPKVVDLNEAISEILKMLQRMIGEDIHLVWAPGRDLWKVKIDPSQFDQLLTNLMVNARDAIEGVGKITIETDCVVLDKEYCAGNLGFLPGEYVLVSVSDNGCGMDKETLSHVFEPFFTTKAMGQGTGLGLATVYGVVKQNNGFINAYSEPGHGTTFNVYLPRHAAETEERKPCVEARKLPEGWETILIVEDEEAILKLNRTILERLGYKVLSAGAPSEAIRVAEEYSGKIDLLITDVVMPEMNGRDLSAHLTARRPDMQCLFTSGYTANVIAHHGVLDEGVHFIQKPFSVMDLAHKIRELLDGPGK